MKTSLVFLFFIFVSCFASSIQWKTINPYPVADAWSAVISNGNGNVAVGYSHLVFFQEWDSFTVIDRPAPTGVDFQPSGACATKDMFYVIYARAYNDPKYSADVYASADGKTWKLSYQVPTIFSSNNLFCSDTQAYIFIGYTNTFYTTSDGSSWSKLSIPDFPVSIPPSVSYSNGYYYIPAQTSYYSPDLHTWTPINSPEPGTPYALLIVQNQIIYMASDYIYSASFESGQTQFDWNREFPIVNYNAHLVYSDGTFLLGESPLVYSSNDLKTWTLVYNSTFFTGISYSSDNGAVLFGQEYLGFSSDLKTWKNNTFCSSNFNWFVTGNDIILAYTQYSGNGVLYRSVDAGQNWAQVPLDPRNQALLLNVQTVTFIPNLGLFFATAIGTLQTANLGAVSKDGSNWVITLDTQHMRLPGVQLQNVVSNGTGIHVLSCNPQFYACYLLYSRDGNSWVMLSNPLVPNGFFAGPNTIIGVDIATFFLSTDGIRWSKLGNVNTNACPAPYSYQFLQMGENVVALGQNCIMWTPLSNLNTEWSVVSNLNGTMWTTYKDMLVMMNGVSQGVEVSVTSDFVTWTNTVLPAPVATMEFLTSDKDAVYLSLSNGVVIKGV